MTAEIEERTPPPTPLKATRRRPRAQPRRFYEDVLEAAEKGVFREALGVDGIEGEIALLRLRLRQAVQEQPQDTALMLRGIDLLARLVASRYRLPASSAEEIKSAMEKLVESALAGREGGATE